jgi:hypothetical protein
LGDTLDFDNDVTVDEKIDPKTAIDVYALIDHRHRDLTFDAQAPPVEFVVEARRVG